MNDIQLSEREINKRLTEESSQAGAERLLRMRLMNIMNEMEANVHTNLLLIPLYYVQEHNVVKNLPRFKFVLKEIVTENENSNPCQWLQDWCLMPSF